jgi:four helix bundle protein
MSVPEDMRQDPLWGLRVYRSALYAAELGRRDSAWLLRKGENVELVTQLRRCTSSISVNIAEGYSRRGRRDRGRFYEYALGSARESRDWYYQARETMGENATLARISLHTSIVRIMTVLARATRGDVTPNRAPAD